MLSKWQPQIQEWTERFLTPIDDPGSRLFHMNIAATLILIAFWLWKAKKNPKLFNFLKTFKRLLFRKSYWWNSSTRFDYGIYLFNSVLKIFLFIPLLDFGYFFSQKTARALVQWNGDFVGLKATGLALFVFTVAAFVFDDFLRFFNHWLMHKVPFLWKLHRTHHSARILTPITLYRAHPLESAIATVRNSLSLGVSTGVFIFLFEARFNVFTFLGVNIFGFVFNLLGSNLRHSHIPLGFGFLEFIFISPKQHQIHHSRNPEHYDKNFGVSLSIWDYLFGSLVHSKTVRQRLFFGLDEVKKADSAEGTSPALHSQLPRLFSFLFYRR